MNDKGFGEFLVRNEVIRKETLKQARMVQGALGSRLDTALLDMGVVREQTMLAALGKFHSTRTVSGTELATVSPELARVIPARVATRFGVVPFRLDGKKLSVASLSPGDLMIEDELSLLTSFMVMGFAALEVRICEALSRLYGFNRSVQIVSLTRRLNGDAGETSGVVPALGPRQLAPAANPSPPVRDSAPTITAVPRQRPSFDVSELEISDEDLELFPSLRNPGEADPAEPLTEVVPATASPVPAPEPAPSPTPTATPRRRPPSPPATPSPPAEPLAAAPAAVVEAVSDVADAPISPRERLAIACEQLASAEMREDIADVLLEFCAPYLRRRMMLSVREDTVLGWRGEGDSVEPEIVRAITIPLSEPSVFTNLVSGQEFWLAPLPPMPRNTELVFGLGGREPRECLILPIAIRSKIMCFLYGDNDDEPVRGVPLEELRQLASKAGIAFQVYLLKGKIRIM